MPVDIFNPFFKNGTLCLSLICTHFRPPSARSPSKCRSWHFSALDFSSRICTTCHHAQWPRFACGLRSTFSPLHSAPPSLPSSPSTASLHTPELQLNPHNSIPGLLHLPSPPTWKAHRPSSTFYLNASFSMLFILSSQFKVRAASEQSLVTLYLSSVIYNFLFCSVLTTPHFPYHFSSTKHLLFHYAILTFIHNPILTSSMQRRCEMG